MKRQTSQPGLSQTVTEAHVCSQRKGKENDWGKKSHGNLKEVLENRTVDEVK